MFGLSLDLPRRFGDDLIYWRPPEGNRLEATETGPDATAGQLKLKTARRRCKTKKPPEGGASTKKPPEGGF
jgi:hypothetical protein